MKKIYVILLFVCIFVNASKLLEEYQQTIKNNNEEIKLIEKEKIDAEKVKNELEDLKIKNDELVKKIYENYGIGNCTICFECIDANEIPRSTCNHFFHINCNHFFHSITLSNAACPICRENLIEDDVDDQNCKLSFLPIDDKKKHAELIKKLNENHGNIVKLIKKEERIKYGMDIFDNKKLIPRIEKLEKRINANMTNSDIIEQNTKDIINNDNIVKALVGMKVQAIIVNISNIVDYDQVKWNENMIPRVTKQIMRFVTENYELVEENKKLAGEPVKKQNVKIMKYEQIIKENNELIKALNEKEMLIEENIKNGKDFFEHKKLIPKINELMKTTKEENEKLSKMINDIIKEKEYIKIVEANEKRSKRDENEQHIVEKNNVNKNLTLKSQKEDSDEN